MEKYRILNHLCVVRFCLLTIRRNIKSGSTNWLWEKWNEFIKQRAADVICLLQMRLNTEHVLQIKMSHFLFSLKAGLWTTVFPPPIAMHVTLFMIRAEKSTLLQKVIQLTLACLHQRARASCLGRWGSRQPLQPFHHNLPTNRLQMWHVMKKMRPDVAWSCGHVYGIAKQRLTDLSTALKCYVATFYEHRVHTKH